MFYFVVSSVNKIGFKMSAACLTSDEPVVGDKQDHVDDSDCCWTEMRAL